MPSAPRRKRSKHSSHRVQRSRGGSRRRASRSRATRYRAAHKPPIRLLDELPTDLFKQTLFIHTTFPDAKKEWTRVSNICAASRKLCPDEFWKYLCTRFGFDREDRTTGFHEKESGTTWKRHFERWSELQHTNETLREAVRKVLKLDPTGILPHPTYGPIGTWDTSNVTDMSGMFLGDTSFNQPLDSWDTSNVTNMSSMFFSARSFNQPLDSWKTSKVTNMSDMFFSARSFNQPLNSWETSKVTNMSRMFFSARSFNQPLNSWQTSNVKNMTLMFSEAESFNQSLTNWDVSGKSTKDMFLYARDFELKHAPRGLRASP